MQLPQAFLIALQFLTALPVHLTSVPDARSIGRSLLYYPVVGLCIGALLATIAWLLGNPPPLIGAAIIICAWVIITGALHLDGLADSADAWMGGLGNRERTLEIMKDPNCGPIAVVTLLLTLLLKFTALTEILASHQSIALIMVPVLGRSALILLFLSTDYVRPQGIGSDLVRHLPRKEAMWVIAVVILATLVSTGATAIPLLIVIAATFLLLRRLMLKRLEGTTGDTAGAMLEIVETAAVLSFALQ